jgi:hypothetical protein
MLSNLYKSMIALLLYGIACLILAPTSASAYVPIYGGPTMYYSTSDISYGLSQGGGVTHVSDSGVVTQDAVRYSTDFFGPCNVRWDASGTFIELGNLGRDNQGYQQSQVYMVDPTGNAVGWSRSNNYSTYGRAVIWNANSTTATELLSPPDTPIYRFRESSEAYAINMSGMIVGSSGKSNMSGYSLGACAVRWNSPGAAGIELGNIGTRPSDGFTSAMPQAVNDSGIAVGIASKYDAYGNFEGFRAVRWDTSGNATELGNLVANLIPGVYTETVVFSPGLESAIASDGTAFGNTQKYDAAGNSLGNRAVRWDASGTAATELGNLGTLPSGYTGTYLLGATASGIAFGHATKNGEMMQECAVRWDPSGTAAIELDNLGFSRTGVYGFNSYGVAVGEAGGSAVYWDSSAVGVDLNTLIDPSSGWQLEYAACISDTGWIVGEGIYDPDGLGGDYRMFLMQVPEPSSIVLLISLLLPLCLFALKRRRF